MANCLKYLLVYYVHTPSELGGGRQIEYPESVDDMHERVNILLLKKEELATIEFAGIIKTEFSYKPEQVVTKYKPEEK
jgi:hypothetical protein